MSQKRTNECLLFTDGSAHPQSKIGYGAYLFVKDGNVNVDELEKHVVTKAFEQTSSTKLELQTLLWALGEISAENKKIRVYTDSQNIVGLLGRRQGFETKAYMTKKGKRIANHELYQAFYTLMDRLDCTIQKIKGHTVSHEKDDIDKIFALVDQASRQALRMKLS